jgi:nucleoside-diphosphate-sugar epimerase
MRILLTGARGFLGRHIRASPAAAGVRLFCASRATHAQAEQDVALGPGPWGRAEFAHALAFSRADAVIHCVGATHGADFRDLVEANAVPAAELLAAVSALATPPRIILIGSAAEYGLVAANAMPVGEDHPCRPRSEYGIAKHAQTLLGLAAAARGLPVLTARLFNPVGIGMPPKLALPSFARRIAAAAHGDGVVRVGDLDVGRDFIDVVEAARLLLALARIPSWPWPIVNVCSGRAFKLRDLLESMIAASGRRLRVEVDPALRRPDDMPLLIGGTARLAAVNLPPAAPDFETLIPDLLSEAMHGRDRSHAAAGTYDRIDRH